MKSKNKQILIIDDDPDILDAMQLVLEGEGYTVTTTEKGEYAEKLHNRNGDLPKLIILDVLLSGRDGRTICKKLKNTAATKHIPIIMSSAHPDAEKSSKAVGADDFIGKPFDVNTLIAKIEKYIKR